LSNGEPTAKPGYLEHWFHVRERGSTIRTELIGGITTFATMAYIIVVNPAILSRVGFPLGASTVATILAALFGTLLMGLYANRPLGVAPYMGENAFIAFGLIAFGVSVEQRLGTVFVAGVVFLVITLLHVRAWLARSISPSMKHSFGVGIGLFLAFVGLYTTGIVTSFVEGMEAKPMLLPDGLLRKPEVPVRIGNLANPRVQLAILGFILMSVLMALRVRGALLIGIAVTAIAGMLVGAGAPPEGIAALPFTGDYSLAPLAFKLDIAGVLTFAFLPVLLTLVLVSFLDTLGTLIAVADAGAMLDKEGNLPDIEKPMLVDALSCVFSALVGTSTSGAYIESATGVREGARTGLAALATAALFAMALFFIPLLEPLQRLEYAYGPALIAVGALMLGSVAKIDFADMTEGVPAFITIAVMIFTFNIANGLTAGLVLYPILKLATGRWRNLNAGAVLLGVLCLSYFVFGLPH